MSLSEHEKKVLAELERGLYAEDEDFARRVQKAAAKTPQRQSQSLAAKRIAGILVAVAGLGVLLVAAIVHFAWMGAVGFVLTLTGLFIATGPTSKGKNEAPKPAAKQPVGARSGIHSGQGAANQAPKPRKSFWQGLNDFFEERWNRRRGF